MQLSELDYFRVKIGKDTLVFEKIGSGYISDSWNRNKMFHKDINSVIDLINEEKENERSTATD